MTYKHQDIEKKWQNYWAEHKTWRTGTDRSKPKYYVLDMFPYPSGSGLHVGHPEGYTATDIIARYKRMKGFNVLHPMGWDAFGLPAEKHALKNKSHPSISTKQNVDNFRRQLQMLGFSYDWDHEINTTDASYYRWTQWIFLKLYKQGLAYVKEAPVNWCEELKAVLANEEVQEHLDSGYTVTQRPLRQWMLRLPQYSEKLLEELDSLDWPEHIKEMQRNWIGKSKGATIRFQLESGASLEVYTTRPDTLFGVSFMVLAPEHHLLDSLITASQRESVEAFLNITGSQSEADRINDKKPKSGVFTGSFALHPVTGARIPVWTANYVLASYGTGSIMAVPCADDRDYEFALQYNLPVPEILEGGSLPKGSKVQRSGGLICNSMAKDLNLNGKPPEEAATICTEWLQRQGLGQGRVQYRIRDWVFSRQRYWGEPIPILHLEDGTMIPFDEADLPLKLPEVEFYEPSSTGESPLANIPEWINYTYKGHKGRLETNTMPQWAGSCWYYLRFIDPQNDTCFVDPELEKYWMPVDQYLGGAEHAVLHLIYARFWHRFLYDQGLVSTKEPFQKLFNQGMILADDGQKMSKSSGNVVNPDDIVEQFGADAFRLYEMFMGPLDQVKRWNTDSIVGLHRFLKKVYALIKTEDGLLQATAQDSQKGLKALHKTIAKVGQDIEKLEFNTAISAMMECVNVLKEGASKESLLAFLQILSPFAPHLAEELWFSLGEKDSIGLSLWPAIKAEYLLDDRIPFVLQVNGKVRDEIEIDRDAAEAILLEIASNNQKLQSFLSGKIPVKTIFVKNRLLNFVVRDA